MKMRQGPKVAQGGLRGALGNSPSVPCHGSTVRGAFFISLSFHFFKCNILKILGEGFFSFPPPKKKELVQQVAKFAIGLDESTVVKNHLHPLLPLPFPDRFRGLILCIVSARQ